MERFIHHFKCSVRSLQGYIFWNQTNSTQIQTGVLCNVRQINVSLSLNIIVHVPKIGINQDQMHLTFTHGIID